MNSATPTIDPTTERLLRQLADQGYVILPVVLEPDTIRDAQTAMEKLVDEQSGTIRWSLDGRYQDATQPTLRREHGHLARSRTGPASVVQSAAQRASLSFG